MSVDVLDQACNSVLFMALTKSTFGYLDQVG